MWTIAKKIVQDVLLQQRKDRRSLPNVPDPENKRSKTDRRGMNFEQSEFEDYEQYIKLQQEGTRYAVNLPATITVKWKRKKQVIQGKVIDLSSTGALVEIDTKENNIEIMYHLKYVIDFYIEPGSMPEGYEMRVKQEFKTIRIFSGEEDKQYLGIQFKEPLSRYALKHKDRHSLFAASLLMTFITLFIILMRAESIIYFKFSKVTYLYSIIAATFLLSRYLIGALYKPVPINIDFTPGVTIIIPCFNEETWIDRTITSCVNQDYPLSKLEVLIVDDCSTDKSAEIIEATIEKLNKENPRFNILERVKYVPQPKNGGKREALASGTKIAKHDLIVFVDSDSFLDAFAIRNLVQPFQDPKMGGVSGRTDVANTYTNGLTKMQSVRYYIAFRIMKAAEAYFDAVTCLSGPLACYKKSIIEDNMEAWLNQKFLGQRATFGDDRSMTNFVLKKHRTNYQDTAICSTIVPNDYTSFLKQQMRWKRSWLRESIVACSFMWKKEPFMSVLFYIGVLVPILAPIVVLYNLVWIPFKCHIFPTTFLVGLLMMSMLMSAAQLLLRRSSTWIYGVFFCLFYEAVLLWQMPIAWVTFWKSTWGTRMTPEDVKEEEKKKQKQAMKKQRKSKVKGAYK